MEKEETSLEACLCKYKYLCPAISKDLSNCCVIPARLFIISGRELRSQEGTTQGDSIAIAL